MDFVQGHTEDLANNNYLCTSKYYGHVYNFFMRANPLRGGVSLGTRDICGRNSTSRKASAIWGPQMLRVVGSFMYIIYTGRLKRVNLTNR